MNKDQLAGVWKRVRGQAQEQWGKLTGDDLDRINGQFDQLVGTLQQRYGWTKEEAERRVKEWAP